LIYSYLTDAYGDVPHTEATQELDQIILLQNSHTSWIYDGIMADLETANTVHRNWKIFRRYLYGEMF
jgi:hypothetical protein